MWKHNYRVAVLTASDKGSVGQRTDQSGPLIQEYMQSQGCQIVAMQLLSDDQAGLSSQMALWCDNNTADLILTTGGTGLSPRDQMPEATIAIADRLVPGIAEAMRAFSMSITKRAMLSRAVCATRKQTLIINLPGSPKAVEECLSFIAPSLEHGLDMLCQNAQECFSGELSKRENKSGMCKIFG